MDILLKELDPGQKYIFQARAKSASGKTSAWSTSFEHTTASDTVAPKPVTSLTWEPVGTSFVATWTAPIENADDSTLKDFKDYQVIVDSGSATVTYYVTQERFDFNLEANRNSFGAPDPTLTISVRVRDLTGNLSTAATDSASNPIPETVTGFVAEGLNLSVALNWNAVSDTDLKVYEVYMETSGSGFTPGPSNLVYEGNSTSFTFPSADLVPHYFKVRAVDVFNQGSAAYASATATPESSTGIDLTPPDTPTGVVVTTAAQSDGSSSISVSWTEVTSDNLSDYVIRYSTDEIAWRYINVPAGQESATISNLIPDTNYYVAVASMSYTNVRSSFANADVYPIETAADTSAPSQPSEPTISIGTLMVQVSHDMTKEAGGDLENDVSYLEVHASTTTDFTPDNTTRRGEINAGLPGTDVSGVFSYSATDATTNLYWKVIAVDRAGNKSTASNQSTGVPGLVENANIANATITSAKIQSIEAQKITAGTGIVNDLEIKSSLTVEPGGHIRSSDYDAGTETGWSLDETGLVIYDGSIHATSLLLQDSNNIIPPQFADFEFYETYYGVGFVDTDIMSAVGSILIDIKTDSRFGNQSLQLLNTVITNPSTCTIVFAPGGLSTTGLNIDVSPGTYIFSGYFKKNSTVDAEVKFGVYTSGSASITSSTFLVNSTTWTRFQAPLVIPSGVTKMKAFLQFGPEAGDTGVDFLIDGFQIERQMTALATASPFKAPSTTIIDGGSIVTGSIRSSAESATVAGQPAWSIDTEGNMQIGDAVVRGSVIVGNDASENSFLRSANYVAGDSGWTIDADGFAEFNNVDLRGELIIYDDTDAEVIRVGKDPSDLNPMVRVKSPGEDYYIKMYNYDDGSGFIRPTIFTNFDDGVNPPSTGYIWYDQVTASQRGRMRLHVESPNANNSTDLWIVGGDNSTDDGYIRVSDEIRATDPNNTGLAESWHNITLATGWSAVANAVPQYKLMPDGTVKLRGAVNRSGAAAAGNMFTLPVGYQPVTNVQRWAVGVSSVITANLVQGHGTGHANIGQFHAVNSVATGNAVYLEPIEFSIV